MDLTWAAPTVPPTMTLTGYDIYQGTSSGGESATPIDSPPVTATSDTVTGLASGTTYYFDVTAVYGCKNIVCSQQSFPSNEASAATSSAQPPAPPPPSGLVAAAAGSSEVDLTWAAPTAPPTLTLTGYDIYQGTSSGGESATPIDSPPVTATSDTVTGLASGTTYYFDVTAVYRTGQSPPSREASATTAKLASTLEPQVVHFGPLTSRAVGVSFTVSASASSGLPVSFSSDTPHVCTVSGSTVRIVAAGRCEIRASQAGNAHFQRAADVIQGFTVASGFTARHGQAARSAGPRTLVVVLLAASILALLAAGLMIIRHRLHSRPPATQAASVRAEPQEGPPAAVHIRVTGADTTHVVRIEPHTGAHSTMIKEVQS